MNKENRIYVDYIADKLSENDPISFGRGVEQWGEYEFKPECQKAWEEKVTVAALQIAASDDYHDFRPKMQDKLSGKFILVDSGAAASCWPVKQFPSAKLDQSVSLQAVNGATLPTYGTQEVTFKIGTHYFTHTFL